VTPPTAEAVRETAQEVLSRDYYDLHNTVQPLVYLGQFVRWIRAFLDWLDDLFQGVGLPIPASIFWWTLLGIALALLAWWLMRWRAGRLAAREQAGHEIDLEDLPSDLNVLLQRSGELAEAGNYVDASRMLYRAALVRLEEERGGFLRRGLTNSEYIRTFRTPWVVENLRVFADLINWKWYRDRNFEADDYRRCREAYDRLVTRLRESA
jgi:HAMP domain-containing protein